MAIANALTNDIKGVVRDIKLPWFMFDVDNNQLITSVTIPEGNIKDSKSIIISETPIPGRNFQPVTPGGNGNRKVSFRLPILRRNLVHGNMTLLKQFENLRNQDRGILSKRQDTYFLPNPKVLYYWGTGSLPLLWYVTKCDMEHDASMINMSGAPQLSYIDIELLLDETDKLYKAEVAFRKYASLLGTLESIGDLVNAVL
jgi:hypothetical protein